jgi:PilZ domain-containing protein
MEHRWGERVALRQTVELFFGLSPPVVGSLENVSSSGAFVRTAGRRPPRGPVEVILREDRSVRSRQSPRLPAYVVRETDSGVGIEWCEFAPRVVRELIVRGRRGGGDRPPARAPARAPRSSGYSPREPNTAMQPRAQPPVDPAAIGTKTLPVA